MLFKTNKEQKEMLNNLRKMETLKVNEAGGISVDPKEIINRKEFKESINKSRKYRPLIWDKKL